MKKVSTPDPIGQFRQEGKIHDYRTTGNVMPNFNTTSVDKLFKLISFSRQPIIPIEFNHEISPLTQKLLNNPKGFPELIKQLYDDFISDLNNYLEGCKIENKHKEFVPVLAGLLSRYTQEQERFNQTDVITEYIPNADAEYIPAENTDNISSIDDYSQKAISFNNMAGLIQKKYIDLGISELQQICVTLKLEEQDLADVTAKSSDEIICCSGSLKKKAIPDFKDNPDYKFSIVKDYSFDINADLGLIHNDLKGKYINCTSLQFSNVFLAKNPKPIVWLKSYASLFYVIKSMKDRFICTSGNISIYKVAMKYFHNKEIGQYFDPAEYKCIKKDVSKNDRESIDKIFNRFKSRSDDCNTQSKKR